MKRERKPNRRRSVSSDGPDAPAGELAHGEEVVPSSEEELDLLYGSEQVVVPFDRERGEEERVREAVGPEPVQAPSLPPRRPSSCASREALRQVGQEVLHSRLDPEAWAQALAECRGTHDDALALYARIRAEHLTRSQAIRHERNEELEARRRGSFQDYKSVRTDPIPPRERNRDRTGGVIDAVFWHVLAGVGLVGCLLAAKVVWPRMFGAVDDGLIISLVIMMQVVPLVAWLAGSGRRGRLSYSGVAQMTACVALISSVMLAAKLLGTGGHRGPLIPPVPVTMMNSPFVHVPQDDAGEEGRGALMAEADEEDTEERDTP